MGFVSVGRNVSDLNLDFFFFFFCTDVVGEETIQIESRYFLWAMIYFPRATGICLRSTNIRLI